MSRVLYTPVWMNDYAPKRQRFFFETFTDFFNLYVCVPECMYLHHKSVETAETHAEGLRIHDD